MSDRAPRALATARGVGFDLGANVKSAWTATVTWRVRQFARYLPEMKSTVISSSPDVMGGTPVFAGTRVPVQTFIEYLEGGESIDEFLEGFPSVRRDQVIAFLEQAKALALAGTE